jgi:hypothetical protein
MHLTHAQPSVNEAKEERKMAARCAWRALKFCSTCHANGVQTHCARIVIRAKYPSHASAVAAPVKTPAFRLVCMRSEFEVGSIDCEKKKKKEENKTAGALCADQETRHKGSVYILRFTQS